MYSRFLSGSARRWPESRLSGVQRCQVGTGANSRFPEPPLCLSDREFTGFVSSIQPSMAIAPLTRPNVGSNSPTSITVPRFASRQVRWSPARRRNGSRRRDSHPRFVAFAASPDLEVLSGLLPQCQGLVLAYDRADPASFTLASKAWEQTRSLHEPAAVLCGAALSTLFNWCPAFPDRVNIPCACSRDHL